MPKILDNECLPSADPRPHIGQQPGDTEFKHAVRNRSTEAGVTALGTEACLTLPTLDAILEGYEVQVPLDAVRRTLSAAHEAAHYRIVRAVSLPVLLMHGEDDQVVPVDASARTAIQLLIRGTLKTYPGPSRGLFATHPNIINADLLAFIEDRTTS